MRSIICTVVVFAAMTGRVSAECTTAPITSYVRDAEIVLLGRIDAARWTYVDRDTVDGTIVNVTVKTLWKGSTPRQIELRQPLEVHLPDFMAGVGQDIVLFVRRLTPERPLRPRDASATRPTVTDGYTAESCASRFAGDVDLSVLGTGRPPRQ